MIEDVIGAKRNGRWDAGSFGGSARITFGGYGDKLHLSPENLMWYRQALIDFQNRLLDIVDAGVQARTRMAAMAGGEIKETAAPEFNIPMIDSPYAPTKEQIAQELGDDGIDQDSDGGLKS